jgi:hypothetical protein
MTIEEMLVITAGGSVRGAIAFGLAMQIGESNFFSNEGTIKTTV